MSKFAIKLLWRQHDHTFPLETIKRQLLTSDY
jgi:hypothetical protein